MFEKIQTELLGVKHFFLCCNERNKMIQKSDKAFDAIIFIDLEPEVKWEGVCASVCFLRVSFPPFRWFFSKISDFWNTFFSNFRLQISFSSICGFIFFVLFKSFFEIVVCFYFNGRNFCRKEFSWLRNFFSRMLPFLKFCGN